MNKLTGILCCTRDGVIGDKGTIPWKSDMSTFTKVTKMYKSSTLLLCAPKTYKTLNKSLLEDKSRPIKIITRENITDVESIVKPYEHVFVIGGSWLYDKLKDKIQYYYVSILHDDHCGDSYIDLTYIKHNFKFDGTKFIRRESNEKLYFNIIKNISTLGSKYKGKTKGDETIGLNGITTRYNLYNYKLPVLTSKHIFLNGIIAELLWFIRGETNVKILNDKGVNFWKKNTNRETLDSLGLIDRNEYDAGPIYGFGFRYFGAKYTDCNTDYTGQGVDQLWDIITRIREDRSNGTSSRRNIISLWDPTKLGEMALPPCHILYQFILHDTKILTCILYQRSGDVGLGVPFNIVSASILLNIICAMTNTIPGELVHTIGNAHIYKLHLKSLLNQEDIYNTYPKLPEVNIKIIGLDNKSTINDINSDSINISEYKHYTANKLKMINTSSI
jgi:thymidylate synthase